ncbi:MAG TPA: tyrosine-type recombinase/integrase [Pyrinomonadaceae bacterium]|nr:tyrosine-type recombinase/integrase [Pyrinomonadaceae bacterium]
MHTSDKTLKEVLDALIERQFIPQSRLGPIKTALKQYAIILGYNEPAVCPLTAYHLPDETRNRLIEERAVGIRRGKFFLGPHAIRNLKNNVSYVIRSAVDREIIGQVAGPLESYKNSNSIKSKQITCRHEWAKPSKYILDPIPHPLEQEITDYETWSTKIVNRDRPENQKKRAVTFANHRGTILRAAGYLVKYRGLQGESISLSTLTEPDNAINFIDWFIEQQRRFTASAELNLARLIVLGKYLSIVERSTEQRKALELRVDELKKYRTTLGLPEKVIDKSKRWISLRKLESVGLSIYPLNARRISELGPDARRNLERNKEDGYKEYPRYAYRVLQSLLMRLIIRLPLRQRNLRELLWNPETPEQGRNLYKRDGKWYIRFVAGELKISHVKGEVHRVEHEFPDDIVDLLEEWLSQWRPVLISSQKGAHVGSERVESGQEFVFLNSVGAPLTQYQVTWAFESATYRFTGVVMNPHMVRTIWATEYIKSTRNFIDAAYMLGDTVETVLKSYAKLLDQDCEKRARAWLSSTLKDEPPPGNGNGSVSNNKLMKMLGMLKANLADGNSDQQLLQSMKVLLNDTGL